MDKQSNSTTARAVSTGSDLSGSQSAQNCADKPIKPTHEQVADAMQDLEGPIADLALMVRVSSDFLERLFGNVYGKNGRNLVYHFSSQERDAALFCLFDVESRIGSIKDQYMKALDGEARP